MIRTTRINEGSNEIQSHHAKPSIYHLRFISVIAINTYLFYYSESNSSKSYYIIIFRIICIIFSVYDIRWIGHFIFRRISNEVHWIDILCYVTCLLVNVHVSNISFVSYTRMWKYILWQHYRYCTVQQLAQRQHRTCTAASFKLVWSQFWWHIFITT